MSAPLQIQDDFSLRRFNTFGVEACARAYLHVTTLGMLDQVRRDAKLASLPRLILGGGSNIVLTRDFDGLVLHVDLRGIEFLDNDGDALRVRAAAGESWHGLVQMTLDRGIGGLENLSWIPGSVGAAPIQNIGAYGVEVGSLIETVSYYDFDSGEVISLDRQSCEFGYRDSVFKHRLKRNAVILDVTFALPLPWTPNLSYAELQRYLFTLDSPANASPANASPTPADVGRAVIEIRSNKLPDPDLIGSAGSFFKNPIVSLMVWSTLEARWPTLVGYPQPDGQVKLAAGWLVEHCGWKGRTLGNVGVYEKQALVLVNLGGGTGEEIMRLASFIQADVEKKFGVFLEPEPLVL